VIQALLAGVAVPKKRRDWTTELVVMQCMNDRYTSTAARVEYRGRNERYKVVNMDDVRPL